MVEAHCSTLLSSYSDMRRHEIYLNRPNHPTDAPLPSVLSHIAILRQKVKEWVEVSHRLGDRAIYHPHTLGIAAVDYLMYCGYLTLADHWLHMEHTAHTLLHENKSPTSPSPYHRDFLESKIQVPSGRLLSPAHFHQTSQFVFDNLLPRTLALKESMFTSSASVMNIAHFSSSH